MERHVLYFDIHVYTTDNMGNPFTFARCIVRHGLLGNVYTQEMYRLVDYEHDILKALQSVVFDNGIDRGYVYSCDEDTVRAVLGAYLRLQRACVCMDANELSRYIVTCGAIVKLIGLVRFSRLCPKHPLHGFPAELIRMAGRFLLPVVDSSGSQTKY